MAPGKQVMTAARCTHTRRAYSSSWSAYCWSWSGSLRCSSPSGTISTPRFGLGLRWVWPIYLSEFARAWDIFYQTHLNGKKIITIDIFCDRLWHCGVKIFARQRRATFVYRSISITSYIMLNQYFTLPISVVINHTTVYWCHLFIKPLRIFCKPNSKNPKSHRWININMYTYVSYCRHNKL